MKEKKILKKILIILAIIFILILIRAIIKENIGINSKILQRCYRLVLTSDRIYKKPIPKDLIEEKKPFLLGNIVESKVN